MKKPYTFQLDIAIATWRHSLKHERFIGTEDLDELEQHVRDEVAARMERGFTEEKAFQAAMESMGNYGDMQAAYRQVYPHKLKREQRRVGEWIWRFSMLNNFLKLAYRNAVRYKSTFLINLLGLSTGLACVLLIVLWVHDERSVDAFHEQDARLYRVMQNYALPQETLTWEYTPGLLSEALTTDMPEIEWATHAGNQFYRPEGILTLDEEHLKVKGLFAGDRFFDVFTYPLLAGDRGRILTNLTDMLISEDLALKLFPTIEDALGKTVTWRNQFFESDEPFQISGVFAKVPANSTIQFDVVIHFERLVDADEFAANWNGDYAETYLVLKKGTDVDEFNAKIAGYLRPKHPGREPSTLFLQRYSDRYLHGQYTDGVLTGGRITYVRLFSIVAFFILTIACINFINLSTAQASRKAKEIGVRKAIGAEKRSLVVQFLGESLVTVCIAFTLAVLWAALLLPQFNIITGKELVLTLNPGLLWTLLAIAVVTGMMAGSYPAFYLAGIQPISVLRGLKHTSMGEALIRKGLVVFQFALSVIFIVGVLVTNKQLEYTQTKSLGYDRDNVVLFQRSPENANLEAFLEELQQIPGVVNAANMVWSILDGRDQQSGYNWTSDASEKDIMFKSPRIGYNAIETLGMEVIEGRSFSKSYNDGMDRIVINETARDIMGLENAAGQLIKYGDDEERQIIGVVRDFHYGSIHHTVEPLVFRLRALSRDIMVRIQPGAEGAALARIEELFNKFEPDYPFEYTFLDEEYRALYEAESRTALLSAGFSTLAIVIACLGLFGLAAFTAEQKTREIGIRKALGASAWGIVRMLSASFTRMVLLAILIAIPASYFLFNLWLNGFAYRISLEWWFFVVAAFITLVIAWLTVCSQTLKAASVNPTICLRAE